jgi:hypothetical protein
MGGGVSQLRSWDAIKRFRPRTGLQFLQVFVTLRSSVGH